MSLSYHVQHFRCLFLTFCMLYLKSFSKIIGPHKLNLYTVHTHTTMHSYSKINLFSNNTSKVNSITFTIWYFMFSFACFISQLFKLLIKFTVTQEQAPQRHKHTHPLNTHNAGGPKITPNNVYLWCTHTVTSLRQSHTHTHSPCGHFSNLELRACQVNLSVMLWHHSSH